MQEITTLDTLVSKIYFLPVDHYNKSDYFIKLINKRLPKNWEIIDSKVFTNCSPPNYKYLEHGWKIHISATIWNSFEILDIVSKYCITRSISFKFIKDDFLYALMQDKTSDRRSSGKFITIYPSSYKLFKNHVVNLTKLLKGYNGPYILTDKRYGKEGVVYYRYGYMIQGESDIIHGPNGEVFYDDRFPIYKVPSWVEDPFAEKTHNLEKNSTIFLNDRYEVISAKRFTNAGGTYIGKDSITGESVIIKEARPYTVQYGETPTQGSIEMKEKEYAILKKLNNYNINFIPQPIDYFKQWEHIFLVETLIKGETLNRYVAKNNPFSLPNTTDKEIMEYMIDVIKIIDSVKNNIKEIHNKNIIINDISPENIILHNKQPFFIDFDSSTNLDENSDEPIILGTAGFYSSKNNTSSFKRDYIGIGYLLFYMIAPNNYLIEIDNEYPERFMNYLVTYYGFPKEIKSLVLELMKGEHNNISDYSPQYFIDILLKSNIRRPKGNECILNFSDISNKIINFINYSKLDFSNQLFPGDYTANNYYCLNTGAAGVYKALSNFKSTDSDELLSIKEWLNDSIFNHRSRFSLGFTDGLCGILWCLITNKSTSDEYASIITSLKKKFLNLKDLSVESGLSGYGLLLVKQYIFSKDKNYFNDIINIADLICKELKNDDYYIENLGLMKGKSGISLFLYYTYKLTGHNLYYFTGEQLLEEELKFGKEINGGYLFPETRSENENIFFPYLLTGTAGITSVVLRYSIESKDNKMQQYLPKLIAGLNSDFSVQLNLFNGISGLIATLHDVYIVKKNPEYRELVYKLINNITPFLDLNNENMISIPGSLMFRYSCDYGHGASGVLEIINKVQNNSLDYFIFIDDLINGFNEVTTIESEYLVKK